MKRLERKGFTLVELMIVVAIIGLLAAIAIPNFTQTRMAAQVASCKSNIHTLNTAVMAYQALTGLWPGNISPHLDAYVQTTDAPTVCPVDGSNYNLGVDNVISCSSVAHDH